MKGRLAGSILLISTAGLFGGDNVLTPQEKAAGWVLLFDGKSLNGWTSAIQEAPARSGGAARSGAPEKAKGSAQPGAAPAVGSNPRTCSTPEGQAAVAEGASHWDVGAGSLSPYGDPAVYLTSNASYKDFVLTADFRTGEDTNSGVFIRSPEWNRWLRSPDLAGATGGL